MALTEQQALSDILKSQEEGGAAASTGILGEGADVPAVLNDNPEIRQLLEESIQTRLGNSAGAAIKGLLQLKEHFTKDDVVVVLFHDHGSRYVGKMFNDDWMKKMGYID